LGSKGMDRPEEMVSIDLLLSPLVAHTIDEIAEGSGSSRTDVIRQALALIKVAHEARLTGKHIGICADPEKLDTEIVGLF
jgi:predicted transcriptional regulator